MVLYEGRRAMQPTLRIRGVCVLLGLSLVLFVIGVVVPVMMLKRFVFFEERSLSCILRRSTRPNGTASTDLDPMR